MADKCQQCGEVEYTWQHQGKGYVRVPFKPADGFTFTCCRCVLAKVGGSTKQEPEEEPPVEQACVRPVLLRRRTP